jgi:hypothetical protein
MTEQGDSRRGWRNLSTRQVMVYGPLILLALVVSYLASYGPVVYLGCRMDLTRDSWQEQVSNALGVCYRPALSLTYRSETYFAYVHWFIAQGIPHWTPMTWEEWKTTPAM